MAKVTVLNSTELPYIWNVSRHVGPHFRCPNNPTDVELTKSLMSKAIKHQNWTKLTGRIPNRIVVNGSFDAIIGFYIYLLQEGQTFKTVVVDGVVSPAPSHSTGIYGGAAWLIVILNAMSRDVDEKYWQTLPTNPGLSHSLRNELLNNTGR
jgi:hypothetical protein